MRISYGDGFWLEVSDEAAKEKVHHLFRTGRDKTKSLPSTSKKVATSKTSVDPDASRETAQNESNKRVKVMGRDIFLVEDDVE